MDEVEEIWVESDFSTGLRTVTTRVTTMGFMAPAPSDVLVVEGRSAFLVVFGFEKNEESDAEGRTIVSDIITDWVEGELEASELELLLGIITVTGSPVRSFSHFHLGFCPVPQTHRRWSAKMGPS